MSHPKVIVSVDGKPVSGLFFERLISLNICDREGVRSDTLELVFNDAAPHFESPRRGALATVAIEYENRWFQGVYVIDSVEFKCLPYTIKVSGHSADFREGMAVAKSRHWDDTSVAGIVAEIAAEYGVEPRIADTVSSHVYEWIGQQDETDLNFLERLAKRHGALFSIKNKSLLWLERGAGKTAGGLAAPSVIIDPASIIVGSCTLRETDVKRVGSVKACYQDRANAARREVVVTADANAAGQHVLKEPYSSQKAALEAAQSSAKELLRGSVVTSCSVVGRPDLMAGQSVIYKGVRPSVDDREFIITEVRHSYSKSGGLRSQFSAKLKVTTS